MIYVAHCDSWYADWANELLIDVPQPEGFGEDLLPTGIWSKAIEGKPVYSELDDALLISGLQQHAVKPEMAS